jgi:photosystem II stability/assembly factor-like uncharacterized protein
MTNLHDVTASHGDIDRAWACGEDGTILFTSNGGATWTPQVSGTTQTLYSIAFIELTGGPVITVGAGGTILMTTDGGQTWLPRPSGTTSDLRDVSDFGFFAVGDNGVILRSSNEGATWSAAASPTTARLNAVSGAFVRSAAGEGGTILRAQGIGDTWVAVPGAPELDLNGLPMFAALDLVAGDMGLVLRSTNGGTTWFSQNAQTTARLNATEYSTNNTSRIYCVGDQGTIRKTTDSGQTWMIQLSGTSRNLNSVFFYLDDNNGYAVGDGGTILRTTDGGGGGVTGIAGEGPAPHPAEAELSVSPNPFREGAVVEVSLLEAAVGDLRLVDVTGSVRAHMGRGPLSPGRHAFELDGGSLPGGVYFLILEAGAASRVTRVVRLPR